MRVMSKLPFVCPCGMYYKGNYISIYLVDYLQDDSTGKFPSTWGDATKMLLQRCEKYDSDRFCKEIFRKAFEGYEDKKPSHVPQVPWPLGALGIVWFPDVHPAAHVGTHQIRWSSGSRFLSLSSYE